MPERLNTRYLVVGSGVAGLHTAWRASQHGDVLLLTKRSLFAAVLTQKSVDECRAFFRELCTPAELQAMSAGYEASLAERREAAQAADERHAAVEAARR